FGWRYVRDGHDVGSESYADVGAPRALYEGEVVDVVIEELGDHGVEHGVDLHLEMLDVAAQVPAFGVALGVPATDQAERVAAAADEADHVGGVRKAVRRWPEPWIGRPIAADRDDVVDGARGDQGVVRREVLAT